MLGSFIGISIEQTEVDGHLTAAVRQSKHGFFLIIKKTPASGEETAGVLGLHNAELCMNL